MNLADIISEPVSRNPIMTIYGEAGVGKTTLAATFPKTIIIRTEDGTQSVVGTGVKVMPVCYKFDDVIEQLTALNEQEHDFETVVIDSITSLDAMVSVKALEDDDTVKTNDRVPVVITPKTLNLAHGSFGGGNKYAGTLHSRIFRLCNRLNKLKNMTVLFIGHTRTKDFDHVDQTGKFSRIELDVNKEAFLHYVTNVDLVGYMKVTGHLQKDLKDKTAKTRIISTDERVLMCQKNLSYLTKNRYGITDDITIEAGVNPLSFAINNMVQE